MSDVIQERHIITDPLSLEASLVVIFISFVAACTSLVSATSIMSLLRQMNNRWKRKNSVKLPHIVARRGVALATGPALLSAFCLIRIYAVVTTGQDLPTWTGMLYLVGAAIYCIVMASFIYSLFDEVQRLQGENVKAVRKSRQDREREYHSRFAGEHSRFDGEHSRFDFEHSRVDAEHSRFDFEHSRVDDEPSRFSPTQSHSRLDPRHSRLDPSHSRFDPRHNRLDPNLPRPPD